MIIQPVQEEFSPSIYAVIHLACSLEGWVIYWRGGTHLPVILLSMTGPCETYCLIVKEWLHAAIEDALNCVLCQICLCSLCYGALLGVALTFKHHKINLRNNFCSGILNK